MFAQYWGCHGSSFACSWWYYFFFSPRRYHPNRLTHPISAELKYASIMVTAGVQVPIGVYHLAPGTPCSRRYALHRSDRLLVQRTRLPASCTRPHKCDHGRQAAHACQQTRAYCIARIDSIHAHHNKVVCVHLPRGLHKMYSTANTPAGFLITATSNLCLLLLLGDIATHLEEVPHPHSSDGQPGTLSPGSLTPPMSAKTAPGKSKTLAFVVGPGDST